MLSRRFAARRKTLSPPAAIPLRCAATSEGRAQSVTQQELGKFGDERGGGEAHRADRPQRAPAARRFAFVRRLLDDDALDRLLDALEFGFDGRGALLALLLGD